MTKSPDRDYKWHVPIPPELRDGFRQYHFLSAIWVFRAMGVVYLLYEIALHFREGVGLPMARMAYFVALLGFSFVRQAYKYWQSLMLIFLLLVAGQWFLALRPEFIALEKSEAPAQDYLAAGMIFGASLCALVFVIYFFVKLRFAWALASFAIVSGGLGYALATASAQVFGIMVSRGGFMNVISFAILCSITAYFFEQLMRENYLRRELLNQAHERSEHLLLNILPAPIADRLKAGAVTIADSYAEVTVMFADIVGFTPLSARYSAEKIVAMLNRMFSKFDRLGGELGLEKIKTIGDAYMVVGGVPEELPDHPGAIMKLAIAMQNEMPGFSKEFNESLCLRIGISTGPIVAGVIGEKKFIYDLWGDTVNMASRMESHGSPGGILVVQKTYELLKDRWTFTELQMDIKGRGSLTVYRYASEA